jgi:hypothetical protein
VSEAFRQSPHNEYLRFSVDGGIFFAIALFLVVLSAFVVAARAQAGGVRILVVVLTLGTMALSFVDNTLSTVQFSVPIIILLGLLAAHPSRATDLHGKHRRDGSFLAMETAPAPSSGRDGQVS